MNRDDRLVPALGLGIAILVGIAVVTGWPTESTVAAAPAARVDGSPIWVRIFGIAQALAFILFVSSIFLMRGRPPRVAVVLIIATVIQLLPLIGPMLLSTDGWSYWSVGRIATLLGGNPYVDVAADFPADIATDFVFGAWREQVTPYGPAWVAASAVAAVAGGSDAMWSTWLFRAGAAAAMVAITIMVSRGSRRPALAAAFVGWNPVFAMQYAGSGHNDAIMAALVIAGLLATASAHHRAGGLAWAVAAAVKWTPLVLIPLQATGELARRDRRSLVAWTLVWLVGVGLVSTLVFGPSWLNAISPAAENATTGIRSIAVWPRLEQFAPSALVRYGPIMVFGIAYLLLMWQAWRGRTRLGLAMGLFFAASPFLWPWYLIMPAALSAWDDDGLAMTLVIAIVMYAGLLYLGDSGSVLDVYLSR